MFCSKCGKEIKEGAKFCTFCGQPIIYEHNTKYTENIAPAHMKANDEDDDKTVLLQDEPKNNSVQAVNREQNINYHPVVAPVNMEKSLTGQKKQKKSGLLGLLILLVVLVIIAVGCLFFIFFAKDNADIIREDDTKEEKVSDDEEESEEQQEIGGELTEEETEEAKEEESANYLEKAQEAYDDGDYEMASQYYAMVIQDDSQDEDAYSMRALALLKQQDCEQAAITLCEGIAATDSEELKREREQLITDVMTLSCSQFNSLGVLVCDVTYDTDGNPVRYTHYSDGTNISAVEECEYDSKGRCTEKTQYNGNMQLEWEETYSYDSSDNMISCVHYNSKSRKEWRDEYEYDMQGRQIEVTRYNADGSLSWWDEYTYTNDENMIKTAHPSNGQSVVIRCELSFDPMGNQTGYKEYDASGNCTYSWEKEYNGLGDVTKYSYGDSSVDYVYDYVY